MSQNYQDMLLSAVRKENVPVTIFLTNGFQIRGQIKAFDNYVIIVEADGKQQMVYKHAVSTVAPLKAVLRLNVVDRVTVTESTVTNAEGDSTKCFTTA
ncbi:MAG: RNA chaperone Hfq [Defluviitaleaceae bacterium]|nr:RNA chaperone Hfq [Defluviitaleaceae bacterium]MCL2275484.1 RNA chaperone Hfq [Defluviitaleaceae bacterium]